MWRKFVTKLLTVVLFLVALVISLISGNNLRYPDEHYYNQQALLIMEGHGYVNMDVEPTAYRPSAYPFFESYIYRIHNAPLAAKFGNAVMLDFAAAILAFIVGRVLEPARVFVPLLLLSPILYHTASTLYPQTQRPLLLVS